MVFPLKKKGSLVLEIDFDENIIGNIQMIFSLLFTSFFSCIALENIVWIQKTFKHCDFLKSFNKLNSIHILKCGHQKNTMNQGVVY